MDLFTRNISDSPLCSYGSIKDAQRHFSLHNVILMPTKRSNTSPPVHTMYGNINSIVTRGEGGD